MPEAVLKSVVSTETPESLGWRAGLPDELKKNESLAKFKTVGEFANDYLATATQKTELEGKLGNTIPKLGDNATPEDKAAFYNALGRPKEAKEYEFDGENENATEWTSNWKQTFYDLGLTKDQAKQLSGKWNGAVQKMVEAHNTALKAEITASEQKLKSEYGDKYEANVELAKRLYNKHLGAEFDKDFDAGTSTNRFNMVRYLIKLAALTGEDRTPQSGNTPGQRRVPFINFDKSPAPPVRR
jgi:hypothetical protein